MTKNLPIFQYIKKLNLKYNKYKLFLQERRWSMIPVSRNTEPCPAPPKEVRIPVTNPTANDNNDITLPSTSAGASSRSCSPDAGCRSARFIYFQTPWHRNKTFILIILILLFVTWIIVYTVLSCLYMV